MRLNILFVLLVLACACGGTPGKDPPASSATVTKLSVITPAVSVPTSTPTPSGVQLTGQGFYLSQAPNGGFYAHYAFTMQNSDRRLLFEHVTFKVNFFGGEGEAVGGDAGDVPLILPTETVAVSGQTEVAARPTRIEVAIEPGQANDAKGLKALKPVDATYQPSTDRQAGARAEASITNPYNVDLHEITVTAVLYDAGGWIVGGASTLISLLPASGTSSVSLDILGSHPIPAKVVVFATISSDTVLDLRQR